MARTFFFRKSQVFSAYDNKIQEEHTADIELDALKQFPHGNNSKELLQKSFMQHVIKENNFTLTCNVKNSCPLTEWHQLIT